MIKIGRIIRRVHSGPVTWVRHHTKLPVKFLYMQPDSLGTDRIADALYSAAAYPDKNCIIIDSGTAITVDCVSGAGRFLGGVIIAGADLQLESLHQSTATLPGLSLSKSKIILPGKSTEECMYAGTAHIIAGGLNHIVRTFGKQLGGKCVILATGGAWPLTERLVDFRFIGVPDMTLLGTALYKE
jgi:type III pantothenate kinase